MASFLFAIADVQPDVLTELKRYGVIDLIGADHVYESLDDAMAAFKTTSGA